jgi:hypothetical protein
MFLQSPEKTLLKTIQMYHRTLIKEKLSEEG